MAKTFTPVSLGEFAELAQKMGMESRTLQGTLEYVYERDITTKSGVEYPLKLRIYTGIDVRSNDSRGCGKDAIRVCLVSKSNDRPLKVEKRVNRVGDDIMARVLDRAREMFTYAINPEVDHCPHCKGLMITREPKKTDTWKAFRSCSNYPNCKHTDKNV